MTRLPPVSPGQILTGAVFNEPMRVETVQSNGPASYVVGLVGTQSERFRKVTLTAADLDRLAVLDAEHSFDGDGRLLRLGLQADTAGNLAAELQQILQELGLSEAVRVEERGPTNR
jgi:hypothetical protein